MAGKEAVVFVVDTHHTMTTPYPDSSQDSTTTRLDVAKQVVSEIIFDMMVRSKTHECGVVVLKSKHTRHHKYVPPDDDESEDEENIPFPNLVELVDNMHGIDRPTNNLIRDVHSIKAAERDMVLRGDFCDGIVLAADAIYSRTSGKKFDRRIVLLTDACHAVQVDAQQLLVVVDSLRAMDCRLEVIGLDFNAEADFDKKCAVGEVHVKQEDDEKEDDASAMDGDSTADSAASGEEDIDPRELKESNERFLIGLAEKTGGYVMAAHEVQDILSKTLGSRIPKSVRYKFIFHIAPGLVLDTARYSLLVSKPLAPKLIQRVVASSPGTEASAQANTAEPDKQDSGTEETTEKFEKSVSHWDPENEQLEIESDRLAKAFRYGADLIPVGPFDIQGLVKPSEKILRILGYMNRDRVPRHLLVGPPYAISGHESRRACAAISALARALHRKKQVAIGTMVKTKDHDPILVAVLPLEESDPIHLIFMQLPFKGDVRDLAHIYTGNASDAEAQNDKSDKSQTCDNLIDSLTITGDELRYSDIPTPRIRSFNLTVARRILDPKANVVSYRKEGRDPMQRTAESMKTAETALNAFRSSFIISPSKSAKNGKRRRGPANYRDFVAD